MSIENDSPYVRSDELVALADDVDRISLESDGLILVDQTTMESMGNLFRSASHTISGWFEDKSEFLGDLRPSPTLVDLLDKISSRRLESMLLPTPIGFKGNVKEYLTVLAEQRIELIDDFEKNILDPLEHLVGVYINRPALMAELKINEVSKKFTFSDLPKLFKERSRFFTGKNTDAAYFLSLYRSVGEYTTVGNSINATMAAIEKANLAAVRKRMEVLEEKLSVLTEYFADVDNPFKLSGNVARELSGLVLKVAEHAEHYTMVRHRTMEFGKAYKESFDAITKQAM